MKTRMTKICVHASPAPEPPPPSARCVNRPAQRQASRHPPAVAWTVAALLSLSLSPAPGASEEAALPKASAEASVGEAGRLGIIQFEGNEAFDREQLLSALRFDFEVQAAAHPLAPLTAYIAMRSEERRVGKECNYR